MWMNTGSLQITAVHLVTIQGYHDTAKSTYDLVPKLWLLQNSCGDLSLLPYFPEPIISPLSCWFLPVPHRYWACFANPLGSTCSPLLLPMSPWSLMAHLSFHRLDYKRRPLHCWATWQFPKRSALAKSSWGNAACLPYFQNFGKRSSPACKLKSS